MDENTRLALVGCLAYVAVGAVIIWMISFAIRSAVKHDRRQTTPLPPQPQQHGFPVLPVARVFIVRGISKISAQDIEIQIAAASEAHARLDAESQGIVVTQVREII